MIQSRGHPPVIISQKTATANNTTWCYQNSTHVMFLFIIILLTSSNIVKEILKGSIKSSYMFCCSVEIVYGKMKMERIKEGIKEHWRIHTHGVSRGHVERVTKYLVDPPNKHIHVPSKTLKT